MLDNLIKSLQENHISYRLDTGKNKKRLVMTDGYTLIEITNKPNCLISPSDGIEIKSVLVAFIKCCLHYKRK